MCVRTYKGRFKVVQIDKGLYTITDQEYPYIGYPLFTSRGEAEQYRAGIHGLTRNEYRQWNGRSAKKGA